MEHGTDLDANLCKPGGETQTLPLGWRAEGPVQQVNVSEGGQAIVGNVTHRDTPPHGVPAQPSSLAHDKTLPMDVLEAKEVVALAARRSQNKNDRQSAPQYGSDVFEPAPRGKDPFRQACQSPAVPLPHAWWGAGIGGSPRQH
jgi:hypothetical protein